MAMKKTSTLILTMIFSFNAIAAASDPLFSKQWGLENTGQVHLKNINDLERVAVTGIPGIDINWIDTKERKSTKDELIVAVLDSGLDLNHPDLKNRIWYNKKLCEGATNTNAKACNGFNFLENSTVLTDDIGHGTHVAGIIAANRNNIGIAGAGDPRIKIMPLKVLNNQVNGFVYSGKVITDVIADAMIFAINNGAEVINLSLGWPKLIDLPKVRKAFELAEEKNVIVVAASGNNNKDLPTFPCSYENVICVGAINNRGELTDFSNHGSKVDIVAPGESIVSTYPQMVESRVLRIKNYEIKRGSSQASPYVAAAVATLKLLHPELTNNEVRNLLFRSSRKLNSFQDNRFVKFGMLDMKEMLELADQKETKSFVIPELKTLTEVKFKNSDRRFSFKLPLKNISSQEFSGVVCFKTESEAITFDQQCVNVTELAAGQSKVIQVSGLVVDLTTDSHINTTIQIEDKPYLTSLVFSRDLNQDTQIKSHSLGQQTFEDMGIISGERRLSRMVRVFDKHKKLNYPEYFYLEKARQTENQTVVSLVTQKNGRFTVERIVMPKLNKVISIHRQDINFDGKLDYFVYTISAKKDELHLYFFNEELKPLWEKYPFWNFKISTFEGLPIENGLEKFEWVKIKNEKLGNVLVPSIYRSYPMPEADNSKVLSERILGASEHQFYLNPVVSDQSVNVELRVLDSVTMLKNLRKELGLIGTFDTQSLFLLKPFPQTEKESSEGKIRSLVASEESGVLKLFELTFVPEKKSFTSLTELRAEKGIEQSLLYPIVNSNTGKLTEEAIFTTLLNRSTAEFLVKSAMNVTELTLFKNDWENPIIALSAIFDRDGEKTYLIESRSSMTMLRSTGESFSLPVYRDSSFPGQSFSETLAPVLSLGRPALFVNSTLIYGERLYSMVDTENHGFIRPLSLSVSIPVGCVPLAPEVLGDKVSYQYVFLCNEASKEVSLKLLPMSHL
jgi:cell wall-associated protease